MHNQESLLVLLLSVFPLSEVLFGSHPKVHLVSTPATPLLVNARLISTTLLECRNKHQYGSVQGYSWVKQLTKRHQKCAERKGKHQHLRARERKKTDKCNQFRFMEKMPASALYPTVIFFLLAKLHNPAVCFCD